MGDVVFCSDHFRVRRLTVAVTLGPVLLPERVLTDKPGWSRVVWPYLLESGAPEGGRIEALPVIRLPTQEMIEVWPASCAACLHCTEIAPLLDEVELLSCCRAVELLTVVRRAGFT